MVKKNKRSTTSTRYKILGGEDYFPEEAFPIFDQKMEEVNKLSSKKPEKKVYGVFSSNAEYLLSLDTLMASTYETEHRNYIIYNEVISGKKIRYSGSFLDIGVGNGDLTKFLGRFFSQITVVDNQQDALNNVPNNLGVYSNNVTKINSSILETIEIYEKKYNFILLSHVLYYINEDKIAPLVQQLYNLLSPNGYILIIYNSGGDRAELLKHFNHSFKDIDFFEMNSSYNFASLTHYVSEEYLKADNIDAMMNILDVCLNDAKANVTRNDLVDYLENGHYNQDEGYYQISMQQNLILIGNSNND